MNRGQSEAIGFVLIFSLIAASTGIVYVVGFSSLDDVRTAEQLDNVERAFDVLDANVRDVSRRGVPSRATELSLGGGDLRLGEPTNVTVRVRYASNGTEAGNVSIENRPIEYRIDDTKVVYSWGAILREDRSTAVMRSDPGWIVSDRRAVIPLFDTSSGGRDAVGGDTTVLVVAGLNSRSVTSYTTGSAQANVSVTVESPRADAWGPFLEERGFQAADGDPSDGTITYYRDDVDEVYVQVTTASISFEL